MVVKLTGGNRSLGKTRTEAENNPRVQIWKIQSESRFTESRCRLCAKQEENTPGTRDFFRWSSRCEFSFLRSSSRDGSPPESGSQMPVSGREADWPVLGCVRPGHRVARKCGELGGVTLTLPVSASAKQHPKLTSVSAVSHRLPFGKYIFFSLDSNLILGTLCSLKKASFIASACASEVSECLRNAILANTGVFVFQSLLIR